ncbi:ArnT family glycosyltransferase [Oryzobacter sp. R7]|uniref:ArnT family glycosyltransferase n=1 Tax=Oryzobacter faecalis TaxID=3388656 RepID=UPI00398CD237
MQRVRGLALVVLGLLVSTVGPRVLAFPVVGLGPDEVAYAVIGRELAEGNWPYSVAFDHKPVGLYLPFALAVVMFGDSVTGLRALALVTASAGYLLAHALARRLGAPPVAAVLLAVTYGWFTVGNGGLAMISEHLLDVHLLGLALLLLARPGVPVALGLGALMALSVGTNYLVGPVVAALGLAFFWRTRSLPAAWFSSVVGFVSVTAALLAPVAIWSDLGDYFGLQADFLSGYEPTSTSEPALLAAWQAFLGPSSFALVVAAAVAVLNPNARTRAAAAWWALGALTVATVSLNQFFYRHYALLLAPALIGLLAAQLRELPRPHAVGVAALTAAVTAWGVLVPTAPWLARGATAIARQHDLGPDRTDPRIRTAEALRDLVGPDRVMYTRDIHLYLLSGAEPPTRFFFPSHHTSAKYTAARGTTRDQEMWGIVARRPEVVVLNGVSALRPAQDTVLLDYLNASCASPMVVADARIHVCR